MRSSLKTSEFEMSQREIRDVTVLKLSGRLVLGEPCALFRDHIRRLVNEGRKKFLLNLADLRYIESSGVGEVVSAFTMVSRAGGSLKLVSLSKKLHEVLQITKLFTVFEVFDTEAAAVKSFETSPFYSRCPICKRDSRPPILDVRAEWPTQTCDCGSEFEVSFSRGSRKRAVVKSLRLYLYENDKNEYLQLVSGKPFTLQIVGGLNLFGSSALKKVWQAIPSPRRVLVDLQRVTEMSSAGRGALLTLLTNRDQEARAAISLEGLNRERMNALSIEPPMYSEKAAALTALGDVSDTPAWTTEVARV